MSDIVRDSVDTVTPDDEPLAAGHFGRFKQVQTNLHQRLLAVLEKYDLTNEPEIVKARVVADVAKKYRDWFNLKANGKITLAGFSAQYAQFNNPQQIDNIFAELYSGQSIEQFVVTWLNVHDLELELAASKKEMLKYTDGDRVSGVQPTDKSDSAGDSEATAA